MFNKFKYFNVKIGSAVYWIESNSVIQSGEFVGWFSIDEINDNVDIFVRQDRAQIRKFNVYQIFETETSCYQNLLNKKQEELVELANKTKYLSRDIENLKNKLKNLGIKIT